MGAVVEQGANGGAGTAGDEEAHVMLPQGLPLHSDGRLHIECEGDVSTHTGWAGLANFGLQHLNHGKGGDLLWERRGQ